MKNILHKWSNDYGSVRLPETHADDDNGKTIETDIAWGTLFEGNQGSFPGNGGC